MNNAATRLLAAAVLTAMTITNASADAFGIAGDTEIGVFIDNDHEVVGDDEISVNINNEHEIVGGGLISVTITHNH